MAIEYKADVVIAGGGLAGLVTAWECLNHDKSVLVLDKDKGENLGGLAKLSFGGVCMVDTPYQKKAGIKDSPELCHQDWLNFADFGDGSEYEWPKKWAEFYAYNSLEYIYDYLDGAGVKFLPKVNWPERGLFKPGNSVPRWHITWGTGFEIIEKTIAVLRGHKNSSKLQIVFEHDVTDIVMDGDVVTGLHGTNMSTGESFEAKGESTVIASGGICGGDLTTVRENWFEAWGKPPEKMLNGAHDYGDGQLHKVVQEKGGNVTHLDKQWHYAAGVHKPGNRRPNDGVSLVPPRSALWFNAEGHRLGPVPAMGYTDTRAVVEQIVQQPGQYSWQIMNMKIALKELAVSGCDYMTAFRYKSYPKLIKSLLFGNKELVDRLIRECPDDFLIAYSVDEMIEKMQKQSLFGLKVDADSVRNTIAYYDEMIDRGPAYFNDDQLRRIANFRQYSGDRIRTCKFQKINDPKAYPLIAVREFILARKSLGGIQTNLKSQVLKPDGSVVKGLYAAGEAAGFGGGGIHGHGSLEGTFLGGCVLSGRLAGQSIAGVK